MGNSTDSIRAERQQARYEQRVADKKARLEQRAGQNPQPADTELSDALSGQTTGAANPPITGRDIVDGLNFESDSGKFKGVKRDVLDELKRQYENGEITKDELKAARDFVNSRDFKTETKEELNDIGREQVVDILKSDEFEPEKNTLRHRERGVKAELDARLEAEEITQAEYEAAMKYADRGSAVGRFFWGPEKESRTLYRVDQNRQNLEETRAALESGDEHLSVRTQARLEASGLTLEDVYNIGNENGGADDATINYSFKGKDSAGNDSEQVACKKALNENENNIAWNKRQSNKLFRELGYEVDRVIEPGKVVEGAARGAVLGAPFSYLQAGQTQLTQIAGGALTGTVLNNQVTKIIGAGPVVAAVIGAGVATVESATRVDDPTNKEERLGQLLNENPEPPVDPKPPVAQNDPDPAPVAEVVEIELTRTPDKIEVPVKTECYTVQSGDNWFAVAKGKYGVSDAEAVKIARHLKEAYYKENEATLKAMGINSARGAFFVKVNDTLCLPVELTVDGKTYTYQKTGNVIGGSLGGDVTNITWSNPFTEEQDATTYGYRYVDQNQGQGRSGLTEEERNKEVEALDAQDTPTRKVNVKEGEVVIQK